MTGNRLSSSACFLRMLVRLAEHEMRGPYTLVVMVRPKVPMYCLQCVPYVGALGISKELGAQIAWPYHVVRRKQRLASIAAKCGYDEKGLFARLEITANGPLTADVAVAAVDCIKQWEECISAQRSAHMPIEGPLAPLLDEYADALEAFGEEVEVFFPNGRKVASGNFCGVDVWGRATVRLASGRKIELAPEQASLRLPC